jgi:hypothetical protein
MGTFSILIIMIGLQMYAYVKAYQIVYLNICILYVNHALISLFLKREGHIKKSLTEKYLGGREISNSRT